MTLDEAVIDLKQGEISLKERKIPHWKTRFRKED